MARFGDLQARLRGGLFLSSMMDITDGAFCASRGARCAMVQLGAYLAEPTAGPREKGSSARSFLPPDPAEALAFLMREVRAARGAGDVVTCLNLATPRLEWGLEAARSFAAAGGDVVELNVHGSYGRYLREGKLRAMVLPENQAELYRWVGALAELEAPLVVKLHGPTGRALLPGVLDRLQAFDLFGVHVNVRHPRTRTPDLALLRELKAHYPGFFLASGYVRSPDDARALLAAGADMVGIAEPAIEDAGYIQRIAEAL